MATEGLRFRSLSKKIGGN